MTGLKFIGIDKLLEMQHHKEKFVLVDVLMPQHYKEGHIPGAINIPVDNIKQEAPKKFKKTDRIVVYCASYSCPASTNATGNLLEMGYTNVMDFKGGIALWKASELPLQKG